MNAEPTLVLAVSAPTAAGIAAGIAAVTSLLTTVLLRYFVDDRLMRRKAETEYRFEQRKVLRQVLGTFDGPLLQAAEELHNRMDNLYFWAWEARKHWDQTEALHRGADSGDHYYRSTVYRFLAFYRLAVGFEQRALYLDPHVADRNDLTSMRYVKALQSIMTDALYDKARIASAAETIAADDPPGPEDHFLRDQFRAMCNIKVSEGTTFDFGYFESHISGSRQFEPVFEFFDDLGPEATPLRWDRLVTMDLLLMAFMNSVGYNELHHFTDHQIATAVGKLRSKDIRDRVAKWIRDDMKLENDPQAKRLLQALQPA